MFAVAQTWHPSARVAPRDLKARHKRVSRAHRRGRVVINVAAPSMPATSNRYAVRSTRAALAPRKPERRRRLFRTRARTRERDAHLLEPRSLGTAKGLDFLPTRTRRRGTNAALTSGERLVDALF
jgi:hypothetical protein